MQGKATLAGHPIHPILVTVPIGCYVGAIVSDIISIWGGVAFWGEMSMWLIGFGVVGSLLAAFFGFVDYLSAPMTNEARSIANWHMTLNLVMVVIFGTAFAARFFDPPSVWGHVLTVAGIVILLVSGVLGGELAHRHLVGSDETERGMQRHAADETSLTPSERLVQEREKARSGSRGTI